jgi:hypothetical protein
VIPTLGTPAKRGQSFQSQPCHLFHLFYQVKIRLGSRRRLKNSGRGPRTPIIARRSSAVLTAMTPESLATADASRFLLLCQQISMLVKQHEHLWMTCPDLLLTDQPYPRGRAAEGKVSQACLRPYRHETYAIGKTVSGATRTAVAAPSGSVPAGVHSLSTPTGCMTAMLVLRPKQRIHFLVMAGLGPAIHVFAADRSARCELRGYPAQGRA